MATLDVEFFWSQPESEHAVERYSYAVEVAVDEPEGWEKIASGFSSERSVWVTLDCGETNVYRWRVQAQDSRGSIGPWSEHVFVYVQ